MGPFFFWIRRKMGRLSRPRSISRLDFKTQYEQLVNLNITDRGNRPTLYIAAIRKDYSAVLLLDRPLDQWGDAKENRVARGRLVSEHLHHIILSLVSSTLALYFRCACSQFLRVNFGSFECFGKTFLRSRTCMRSSMWLRTINSFSSL